MKIRPLRDRLVIQRLEADERTAGGIILPDTAREKPKQGRVIAVGEGRQLPSGACAKAQVSKGDLILFASYAGTEVTIDGDEYLVMPEEDVLAVIE